MSTNDLINKARAMQAKDITETLISFMHTANALTMIHGQLTNLRAKGHLEIEPEVDVLIDSINTQVLDLEQLITRRLKDVSFDYTDEFSDNVVRIIKTMCWMTAKGRKEVVLSTNQKLQNWKKRENRISNRKSKKRKQIV